MDAVRLRLRPIVMTSLAFGLGVLPLAIANGAGSGAQNAIGWGVLGGMITGTFLCVLFVPIFYVLIMRVSGSANERQINVAEVVRETQLEQAALNDGDLTFYERDGSHKTSSAQLDAQKAEDHPKDASDKKMGN